MTQDMNAWARKWAGSRWTKVHPNNVVTHGSTEPLLSVLDVCGFEIRDLFLMGINDSCGAVIFPTRERAEEFQQALAFAYRVSIEPLNQGDWKAKYDRREIDGSVPSHLVTDLTLKDGRTAIRNGRWVI